jgi:hypothetical protein
LTTLKKNYLPVQNIGLTENLVAERTKTTLNVIEHGNVGNSHVTI